MSLLTAILIVWLFVAILFWAIILTGARKAPAPPEVWRAYENGLMEAENDRHRKS